MAVNPLAEVLLSFREIAVHKMSPHVHDAGFSKEQLARVPFEQHQTLTCSLDGKLQPVLAALEGVLGSPQAVVEAVSRAPGLLGSSVNTLDSNVRFLRELGLSDSDIGASVSKQPQLFYKDYTSAEFQNKLRYFEVVLCRCPQDMFLQYPGYLMSGLHKIDYRSAHGCAWLQVSFMERKEDMRFQNGLSWIILATRSSASGTAAAWRCSKGGGSSGCRVSGQRSMGWTHQEQQVLTG